MELVQVEKEVPFKSTLSIKAMQQEVEGVKPRCLPLRCIVTDHGTNLARMECGYVDGCDSHRFNPSIFGYRGKDLHNEDTFNVVLMVPTGIGAEIGGHAGDAGPVAKLIGNCCDRLILHPNVVNASDINEMPENAWYLEGSLLTRLLMGTIGVKETKSNRVLVVIAGDRQTTFVNDVINSVNAARACYGLNVVDILHCEHIPLKAEYTSFGTAAGSAIHVEKLMDLIDTKPTGSYDAIAVSSVIDIPSGFHKEYFQSNGKMVNPWGGIEAMLTHLISNVYNVPSAHAPMMESMEVAFEDYGIVDPRMSAEAVSMSFIQCILKGLHKAPKLVHPLVGDSFKVEDIDCLVIPDGCYGLSILAAAEQAIPIIAVQENANNMNNDLLSLVGEKTELIIVDNYWEAVGVLTAMKAGITPGSVRRPLK